MSLRIDVAGLQMNDGTVTSGTFWDVLDMQGWDSAPAQPSVSAVTAHHGGGLVASQWPPRTVTIKGRAVATTEADYWNAQQQLAGLVGLLNPVTFSVYESTATKSLSVILNGPPRMEINGDVGLWFDWSLSLLALDPFKRGASHTVAIAAGASASITYAGSHPAAPTITTTAAGTVDVACAASGTRVQAGAVPNGTAIVCHEPGHTVYAGTTNLYGALVQPVSWLRLIVGANSVVNNGTAPVSLTYSDLYL